MCRIRLTAKSCVGAALGFALGASLVGIPSPARAGDDDVPLDTKIFRNIMSSLGLQRSDESGIEYKERPPLVIPPNDSLPPPQKTDGVVNNPAWPKDPDVARARAEAKHERNRDVTAEIERDSNPLRPDQLTPGRKGMSRARHADVTNPSIGQDGTTRLSPSELGSNKGLFSLMFGRKDEENVKFTGEPPRSSLIEPPPGYQTPSPDQPYGNAKAPPPKADNYYVTNGEVK